MHEKQQELRQLLTLFLQINCEPSDDQFHALAHSLGVDKESLESIAYEMLGEEVEHEQEEGDDTQLHELVEGVSTHFPEGEEVEDLGVVNAAVRLTLTAGMDNEYGEEGLSEQQEALQGEGDVSTMNSDDLMLTDGAPAGESTDDELQDSALVDGVGEDDIGIGFDADKSMLLNDGAPALQLHNASAKRLMASVPNKIKKDVMTALTSQGATVDRQGDTIFLIHNKSVEEVKKILEGAGWKYSASYREFEKENEEYTLSMIGSLGATKLEFIYLG